MKLPTDNTLFFIYYYIDINIKIYTVLFNFNKCVTRVYINIYVTP